MEQRRLRLGDILDDYCPRERRVTNHAVVAMIEEDVKQTRCTTCDAEHVYKGARVPRRRKKETAAVPALAGTTGQPLHSPADELDDMPDDEMIPFDNGAEPEAQADAAMASTDNGHEPDAEPVREIEDGPVHRPLIRATLPRPEGHQKEARPVPEFTVRQPGTRGNGHGPYRAGKMRGPGGGSGNGNRPHGRFSRGPGGRGGGAPGFRSGPPRQGGRKRSR